MPILAMKVTNVGVKLHQTLKLDPMYCKFCVKTAKSWYIQVQELDLTHLPCLCLISMVSARFIVIPPPHSCEHSDETL